MCFCDCPIETVAKGILFIYIIEIDAVVDAHQQEIKDRHDQ